MNNKAAIRNIICVAVSVILAVWLVFMIRAENQKLTVQTTALEEGSEKAYPYEKEVRQLRAELQALLDGTSYASDRAEIMVGFMPTSEEDFSYIRAKSEEYGFMPIIVLDCTKEKEEAETIIEWKDKSWELMLYASSFSEETNESVKSVLDYLNDNDRDYTGVFFLRNDDKTSANKASMIFVFDMSALESGKMTDEYVTSILDKLKVYADDDACSFAMVADVVDELSNVNSIEADNMESYEEQAAGIQERIDELENTISEIYDNIEY